MDLKLYEGRTFTRPPNYGVEKGAHLSPQVHTSRAATGYREWVKDFDGTAARYYALITGVDAAVGMIREELTRLGLDRNTVIIFTSDNGYNAGSHGFGDKVIPYEEGSRAPLIIFDPRLPAEKNGKACDALTGNIDMAATIFALAGEPAPEGIDGRSLLPLLADPADKVRDFLPLFNFWGIPSAQSMAVVTPEWKYIHWYFGGGMQPTEELFDLSSDRYEMSNSVADAAHAKTLAILREYYDKQLADIERQLARQHGYDNYPTVFSRTVPWERKAALVNQLKLKRAGGEGAGETLDSPRKKRKAGKGMPP
jgi:arylsulfatase A-like enzyme